MLQAEGHDRHLLLWPIGGEPSSLRATVGAKMIARSELLPGNIGYIDLRTFTGTTEEIDAAIRVVQNGKALIIDLGQNLGGNPPIVRHLSSYFFATPTHLLDVLARGMTQPEQRWTLADVPGPPLPHVPIYILTSARTFSAAESFAFGLRAAGRAKIVGEKTAGGGHFVTLAVLPHRFRMAVPIGRAYDPRTGKGWQGDGISPDVEAPYADALQTAVELIQQTPD